MIIEYHHSLLAIIILTWRVNWNNLSQFVIFIFIDVDINIKRVVDSIEKTKMILQQNYYNIITTLQLKR